MRLRGEWEWRGARLCVGRWFPRLPSAGRGGAGGRGGGAGGGAGRRAARVVGGAAGSVGARRRSGAEGVERADLSLSRRSATEPRMINTQDRCGEGTGV